MGRRAWRYLVVGLVVGAILSINSWSHMILPDVVGLRYFPDRMGEVFAIEENQSPQELCNPIKKRASSAIALTSDDNFLLVVNPDSNSLTVIDLLNSNQIFEINVGIDPRTVAVDDCGDRAFVSNRGSDSISVVDIHNQEVIAEIPVGDRPYGVLLSPDSRYLYVAESGVNRLRVIDTLTFETIYSLSLPDKPSGLAITDDGLSLYVTHLLSGQVSFINLNRQVLFLPLIHLDSVQPSIVRLKVKQTNRSASTSYLIKPISLWPDSNLVQSIVLSPDQQFAFVPHTRSITSNRGLTFDTTVSPLVSIIDIVSGKHLLGEQFDLGTLDPPGVGLPFDADLTPDGQELWVLNAASNDISVVDLTTRQLAAHIEVGHNPRGIVISNDGSRAYVNNTLAGTVSVIETGSYSVIDAIKTTDIPLPPLLLNGKRLFHSSDDPRISLNQWIACNTCHFEGEHDGRTWFFGFAGPRNTTSLLGMIETYPLRWSGEWDESADSEFANRKENFGLGLIEGDMNCSLSPLDCVNQPANQGLSYDLDSLAAFIDSLQMPISPGHATGQPLTDSEQKGQIIFNNPGLGCIACHPPPLYTDKQKHDVGTSTIDEKIGPEYDTPSLMSLYNSAPYFHDGSAENLYEALTRETQDNEHDVSGTLSEIEIFDLIAFLEVLPYEE